MKTDYNLNNKSCERHFVDKCSDRKFNDKPKDLRERLNFIRAQKVEKNSQKISKNAAEFYSKKNSGIQDLKEETSDSGFETSVDESKKVMVQIKRPNSTLSLSDAIKISLGLMRRPRNLVKQNASLYKTRSSSVVKVNTEIIVKRDDELKISKLDEKIVEISGMVERLADKPYVLRAEAAHFLPSSLSAKSKLHHCQPVELSEAKYRKNESLKPKLDPTAETNETTIKTTQHQKFTNVIKTEKKMELPGRTLLTFSQTQLETIGREALLKLTEEQRFSIQYISTVTPKYFMECYNYFIEYNVEIQRIPLDLNAVDTYLKTRGINLEDFRHSRLVFH